MIIAPFFILAFSAQEPAPADAPSPKVVQELAAAAQALAEAGSYTFVMTTTETGVGGGPGGFGGPRRGGGDQAQGGGQRRGAGAGGAQAQDAAGGPPAPQPVTVTGHVQKDRPLHLLQGNEEAWRNAAGVLVYRDAEGKWSALDRGAMRRGGGRGGRDGGGAGADAAPQDMDAMRARMGLMRTRVAQETLQQLTSAVGEHQVLEEQGADGVARTTVRGMLTDEGLDAFGARVFGGRGGRRGGDAQGDAAPQMTRAGHCEVVIEGGQVRSLVVETVVTMGTGEGATERKRRVELKVHHVGETSLEVPAEVQAAFEAAAASAETAKEEEF